MISTEEQVIPLTQVRKYLPPTMPKPHPSTCVRWALRGVGDPPIRLETIKFGGRRLTSVEAINRFIAALTVREGPPQSVTARSTAHASADSELAAEGW